MSLQYSTVYEGTDCLGSSFSILFRVVIYPLNCLLQLLLMPVLNGKAILYTFLSVPEVRIGVAFGSGGSQSLPATELPGVSSWLV